MKKIWTFYIDNLHWILKQIYYSPLGEYITPNRITYTRTIIGWLCIPLIAYQYIWTALTFLIISLYLDHIDGVWARLFNQETRWGGYIDRTADKLFVIPFLLFLEFFKPFTFCSHELFFYVIIPLVVIELIALQWSLFQWISEYVPYKNIHFKKNNNAQWTGKVKMLIECVIMIAILLFNTVKNPEPFVKTLFFFSIFGSFMAIISIIGHIKTMQFKKLPSRSISKPS